MLKNGRTWITGIGGGGATPTATTGREVAKAAIDGPKKAAATSSGKVIRPQSANLDGVSGMGIGHPRGAEVPGRSHTPPGRPSRRAVIGVAWGGGDPNPGRRVGAVGRVDDARREAE